MKPRHIYSVLRGVTERELIKFVHQPGRFLSALVRPFLWFAVFGVGFQDVLGAKIMEPYRVPIVYQEYVVPGLLSMIALFNGMQSSLAIVYDREMGVMKVLLTSPVPRYFLLAGKLWAGALLSLLQMLAFLGIACAMGIHFEYQNIMVSLPIMLMVALMLGALGLVLSVMIKQLENFSGTMNFVIFPLFFLSSALYPIWKVEKARAQWVAWVAKINPFTYAVEGLRLSLYGYCSVTSLFIVNMVTVFCFILAVRAYSIRGIK